MLHRTISGGADERTELGILQLNLRDDLIFRLNASRTLTRPELAVLQAHVKMHTFKLLMQEDTDLIRSRTGLVIDAYFSGTKVGWLLENADDDLVTANALNGMNNHLARLIGPALGGLIVATDIKGATLYADPAKVIEVNRRFAEVRPDVPLHLGVTFSLAEPRREKLHHITNFPFERFY